MNITVSVDETMLAAEVQKRADIIVREMGTSYGNETMIRAVVNKLLPATIQAVAERIMADSTAIEAEVRAAVRKRIELKLAALEKGE